MTKGGRGKGAVAGGGAQASYFDMIGRNRKSGMIIVIIGIVWTIGKMQKGKRA